jgi:tRNA dimethylallyltransferase
MNIGTAVPSASDLARVKHHFIQVKSIRDYYNASMYENEVLDCLDELFRKYDKVIMSGGSGLYIDAVRFGIDDLPEIDPEVRSRIQKQLDEEGIESLRHDLRRLDPESYRSVDLKNPKRIQKALEISIITGKPYSSFLTAPKKQRGFTMKLIALNKPREELYDQINRRVLKMTENGLQAEARRLYPFRENTALNTVGYREMFEYFDGKTSLDEAVSKIQSNTRKYARKQLTWFKKDPGWHWFHPDDREKIIHFAETEK